MKKINVTLLVLLISLSGIAQYKKASYFGKDGRTYGLGTRIYNLGGYSGTVLGYTLSLGKDSDGKQFFSGQEAQFIPSYKVQLMVLDVSGGYKSMNFTTKLQFLYGINFGWFLLNNDNSERKVKPYVNFAIGVKFTGGIKETYDFTDEIAADLPFSINLNGGAGLIYYMKPWLGLKAEGGYSYQNSLSNSGRDQKESYALPNHTYVNAGLVFRIISK